MWHPACVPSLHDVEAGTCGRSVAPGSHSSAQIRIGRTTGDDVWSKVEGTALMESAELIFV